MADEEQSADVLDHLKNSWARAERARANAQVLLDAGYSAPALVWAVRAAEILMRDYVLAPYYIGQGDSFANAMRKGSNVLGTSAWDRAFQKVDEWWGPFEGEDAALMEDDSSAWKFWSGSIVRRRGQVVHGNAVPDVTTGEAAEVCAFGERMATWFQQRFVVSETHPLGIEFRRLLNGVEPPHHDE